jgi:hypothetical protein
MNLHRIGKKVIVRPYKVSDYKAYFSILPKPKNIWDITAQRDESKLKISDFKKILESQKKNQDEDYFFDFGIFLKRGNFNWWSFHHGYLLISFPKCPSWIQDF